MLVAAIEKIVTTYRAFWANHLVQDLLDCLYELPAAFWQMDWSTLIWTIMAFPFQLFAIFVLRVVKAVLLYVERTTRRWFGIKYKCEEPQKVQQAKTIPQGRRRFVSTDSRCESFCIHSDHEDHGTRGDGATSESSIVSLYENSLERMSSSMTGSVSGYTGSVYGDNTTEDFRSVMSLEEYQGLVVNEQTQKTVQTARHNSVSSGDNSSENKCKVEKLQDIVAKNSQRVSDAGVTDIAARAVEGGKGKGRGKWSRGYFKEFSEEELRALKEQAADNAEQDIRITSAVLRKGRKNDSDRQKEVQKVEEKIKIEFVCIQYKLN